jgi:hypothetical protein
LRNDAADESGGEGWDDGRFGGHGFLSELKYTLLLVFPKK